MITKKLYKTFLFIKRDFLMLWSYKVAFFSAYLHIIILLFVFFALGTWSSTFSPETTTVGDQYKSAGGFIEFILLGSIGWAFQWSIVTSGSASLRKEMLQGTIESVLSAPVSPFTIVASYTLFGTVNGILEIMGFIIIGKAAFDVDIYGSLLYGIVIIMLTFVMMFGLNLIFSGVSIQAKQIGSLIPILQMTSLFLCEVYIPLNAFPPVMSTIAQFYPFYYTIRALRNVLSPAADVYMFAESALSVGALAVVFLVAGIVTLKVFLAKSKREGSLAFY
ncbi:MAG: ABC transporter permease [Theionarchaea archaeon]|nr:ABC transporter permease [Theionarchaea archaeon]MBU7022441.1 ABC transporter permease [Theionarchaea archaeon]MBU7034440.1 ABC transporter permease [Theionarchaea archaeon]